MQKDLETIRQLWRNEPEYHVRVALARDIRTYPPEVQSVVVEVAKERGIIAADEVVHIPVSPDGSSSNDQSLVISSSLTFIHKYVFPMMWITISVVGAIAALPHSIFEALFWMAFGPLAIVLFRGIGLKRVEILEGRLLVSNYFRCISIPATEIADVSESRLGGHPVWITFRNRTAFGKRIVFLPTFDLSSLLLLSHPVVKELRRLARGEARKP